ncbi:unnamed protein product [Boreogadus saida]
MAEGRDFTTLFPSHNHKGSRTLLKAAIYTLATEGSTVDEAKAEGLTGITHNPRPHEQLVIRRGLGRFQTVTSGHEAVGTLCKLFTGATPETDPGACLNAPRLANGGIYRYASPFFPTPIYPSPCRSTPIYLCAFPC